MTSFESFAYVAVPGLIVTLALAGYGLAVWATPRPRAEVAGSSAVGSAAVKTATREESEPIAYRHVVPASRRRTTPEPSSIPMEQAIDDAALSDIDRLIALQELTSLERLLTVEAENMQARIDKADMSNVLRAQTITCLHLARDLLASLYQLRQLEAFQRQDV